MHEDHDQALNRTNRLAREERTAQLSEVRRLMTALVAPTYDETAGGLAGFLALGADWLQQRQLGPLAWLTLKRAYSFPPELGQRLRQDYYLAVGSASVRRQELTAVLNALRAGGLQPVVFKGAAFAYLIYPDPACRPTGDIDLWLSASQMPAACEILTNLGYQQVGKVDRPFALMAINGGEIQFYGQKPRSLVELHWGVFPGEWLRRVASVDEAAILQRCVNTSIADLPALTLAPEDSLIQLAVHHAISHSAGTPWLRTPIDMALLANHFPLDWAVIVQRAREWRVATATWLMLSLAADLCGLDEAAEAAQQLAPSRLRQKLIGLFANAGALVAMRDLALSRWRYVYLLLVVDRRRDVLKLLYRTLWPEDEWLQVRYGRADWRIRLRHFFGAARGHI